MTKTRAVIIALLLLIFFGLAGLSVLIWKFLPGGKPSLQPLNTATLIVQVQSLSQLVTVKYVVEKVVVMEDPPKSMLSQLLPGGESRIIMVAHGIVKAGVDLGKLKQDQVTIRDKKIILKLPESVITDVYLDDQKTQVVERTTGLLRQFDKNLEQEARRLAVDDIKRAARVNGILKEADERARLQLRNLFLQLGFTEVEFR